MKGIKRKVSLLLILTMIWSTTILCTKSKEVEPPAKEEVVDDEKEGEEGEKEEKEEEEVFGDVAQGKNATASTSLSGYEPDSALDGDESTRWCAADGNYPQWFRIDLGRRYDLAGTSFDLSPEVAGFKYLLSVSSDDREYIEKADKTLEFYSGEQIDRFQENSIRFIRVLFTESNSGDWASLTNFKVFGVESEGDPGDDDKDVPSDELPAIQNPEPIGFPRSGDHRAYMHGIDMLQVGEKTLVVFSSDSYPPVRSRGDWHHDIYHSWIDPIYPNETFNPSKLVDHNMAQEPASAAINSNGRIVITAEDAQHHEWLDQTYGMWDSELNAIIPYGEKLMPPQGGHSGHVAASGDKFLVSFSDGWVSGGAVDGLGTGDEIYGKIIYNDGSTGNMIRTSTGLPRDWWPIVAGSDINWLQVWQRYEEATHQGDGGGTVWGAIISHEGSIVKRFQIYNNNKYYYHDVKYLSELGLYIVIGSQNKSSNAGIVVLIDKAGNVVKSVNNLPSPARQGQPAISERNNKATVVYPTLPTGATVLDITSNSIEVAKELPGTWEWDYMGIAGMFSARNRVLFAATSHQGVYFIMFDI